MLVAALMIACSTGSSTDTGSGNDTSIGNPDDTDTGDTGEDIGGDTSETGDSVDTQDTADEAADEAAYQAFYDENTLQSITISLSAESMDAMDVAAAAAIAADPENPTFDYVSASVTLGGVTVDNVGVKFKGGSKSFQDWEGKPSLKIKFDQFDDTLRFAGLKRVTLDNMVTDPAMCREVLGFKLFRDGGVPAPRANFAQVYVVVDGGSPQLYGLYTNVEAMDSKWVKHNYEEDDGDLWQGHDSADFSQAGIKHFELAAGTGDLAVLDQARVDVQNHGDDFWADVDDVLDMDNFLDFWTLSVAMGNRGGYPFHVGNFYVYGDPADGRFDFIPAEADASFDTATPTYAKYVVGAVAQFCLYYDDKCPAKYTAAQSEAITFYEGDNVAATASALQALTDTAIVDDARKNLEGKTLTTAQVLTARDTLNYRVEMYPEWLRGHLGL